MQNSEKRREARFTPTDQSQWQLLIHSNGKSHPVGSVLDISNSGISVLHSHDALDDGKVFIEYRSNVIDFRIEGSVIWKSKQSNEAGQAQNVLGLKLSGPPLLMEAMQGTHG
jgi:hypothetical protein